VAICRQRALAYLTVVLIAGTTGCGSSGGSPLASDSVTTIITEATADTIAAQSFTVSGGTSANFSVDLTIVRGVGCSGTIVQGGTKWNLIWDGKTVYAHTASMPANQWMKGSSSEANIQGLIDLCQPSSLLAPLNASGISSATRSVTVYDGQPALTLTLPGTGQDNGQSGSIVVTDMQAPLLLNISEPGSGNFTFTRYGATKTITPPAVRLLP
jgi:hypothetical protein